MNLGSKFILFTLVTHVALLLLAIQLLPDKKFLFIGAEALILISIGISIHLYRSFLKPLKLIAMGIESIKHKDFSAKFVTTGQHEMDQLIEVYSQMIDQLRDDRAKQQEQHFFLSKLIQASPSGIIVLDFEDKIKDINPAALYLIGTKRENAMAQSLAGLSGKLAGEMAQLQSGESKIIKINGIKTYKCQKSHFMDKGFRHHFILIQELTQEMLSTEKKAYEKVIRMMSHEVNNSIGAINSILSSSLYYKEQLKETDRPDYENAIHVAIDRNNRLSRFMSNFAEMIKIPIPRKETIDLHLLLKSVRTLMAAQCDKRQITWCWNLCTSPLEVEIDIEQMEMVLVNIIKNSFESIEKGGEVVVSTNISPPRLIIRDNGKGIDPEVKPQIFAPFFSTKKEGQGIGLTLIREILLNHGFNFSLESKETGWTEFLIGFEG